MFVLLHIADGSVHLILLSVTILLMACFFHNCPFLRYLFADGPVYFCTSSAIKDMKKNLQKITIKLQKFLDQAAIGRTDSSIKNSFI